MLFAHPGHGEAATFAHGLSHPINGLDHLLAMIAVGLWAAQLGGRDLIRIPTIFVVMMTSGGGMGWSGLTLPYIETGILLSILFLGLFIAYAWRLTLPLSGSFVGLFALCHGYAHGAEMPAAGSPFSYMLGFIVMTAALHAIGILAGIGLQKWTPTHGFRWAGTALIGCSFFLYWGN